MEVIASALFPTLVWTARFEDHEPFNAHLLDAVARLREQDPVGVGHRATELSERRGLPFVATGHHRDDVAEIVAFIEDAGGLG